MRSGCNILCVLILGLTLFAGCATKFVDPVAVTEGTAVEDFSEQQVSVPLVGYLTFIRIEAEPEPTEMLLYIHDELAAVIGSESFVTLCLPEGTNTLTFDWEGSPLQFEEVIVLDPVQQAEQYISLIRNFDIPEIRRTTNSTDFTMVEMLGFIELSEGVGTNLIKNLEPDYSFTAPEYKKM